MFDIQPSSATPIYRQVVEQARRLVASGQLPAGSELPSVRGLAERHAINPMTVSKAYSLLEAEGLLERRRGIGMVVAASASERTAPAERLQLLEPALAAAASQAVQLGLASYTVLRAFEQALQRAVQSLSESSEP